MTTLRGRLPVIARVTCLRLEFLSLSGQIFQGHPIREEVQRALRKSLGSRACGYTSSRVTTAVCEYFWVGILREGRPGHRQTKRVVL